MALFRARFLADDIYQITGEALQRRGIRLLLADLDNTLAPYGAPVPDERLKAWRDELAEHGVTLFILSNNRHESRPRIFAEALDVPYIGHAGKPKTASFFKAMERMKAAPEQTAIVGDQIFTDILGATGRGWPPFWCARSGWQAIRGGTCGMPWRCPSGCCPAGEKNCERHSDCPGGPAGRERRAYERKIRPGGECGKFPI